VAFEPDQTTLDILGSEHRQFQWIGPTLWQIANRIRSCGGSKRDYQVWVQSSYLWRSYQGCTRDSATKQGKTLEGAWRATEDSKPFDLDESLTALADRITSSRWVGRSGSRNQAVALAFVGFCLEHNCFTRTISSYELSKHTAGMSPTTVYNAMLNLVELGLLGRIERTDNRRSSRSTGRYEVNLKWSGVPAASVSPSYTTESMSTSKYSLLTLCNNTRDLWSSRGLGQTAGRVYNVLADEPATLKQLSEKAGMSYQSTRHAAAKLADNALAGVMPGRPVRYFKVETPLGVIEDLLGCTGYVDHQIAKTVRRQEVNRTAYPRTYAATANDTTPPPF
jgi:hypothetical protein